LQYGKIKSQTTLLEDNLGINEDPNSKQNLINLLIDFHKYKYTYIKTKKGLVSALAKQSFYYSGELRKYMLNTEKEDFYCKFNKLFKDFQVSIQHSYILQIFAMFMLKV
jgi:hypothetical protein